MNSITLLIIGTVCLLAGYVFYGRWLAKTWGVDVSKPTPAVEVDDGVDFVSAKPSVLLGHHFSSIAGAGPITGPIQAAVFGWLPVTLWIIIGGIFFGAVHDFGALFASVRNKGKSIGELISQTMGRRAKLLFLLFAYLTLILVIAAFSSIVADTFEGFNPDGTVNATNGTAASISLLFIVMAVVLGYILNRFKPSTLISASIAVALLIVSIVLGVLFPVYISGEIWIWILAIYVLAASVLPVWILLQPRDYMCSFLLYGLLAVAFVGILVANPTIHLPHFTSFETNLGYLFPALFITVACGAISGFHSLVSSGTTSKQLDNERNMLRIGYGGMIIECVLALIALICVGILYTDSMPSGTPTQIFAQGVANITSSIGLAAYEETAYSMVILAVSAFALTSLDTATRLGRFLFQEMFERDNEESVSEGKDWRALLSNPYVATVITVALGISLALVGYQNVWALFGTANQLLALIAMLAVAAWLGNIGKKNGMLLIPMAFMVLATMTSLISIICRKTEVLLIELQASAVIQIVISALLLILALFLLYEGITVLREQMQHKTQNV